MEWFMGVASAGRRGGGGGGSWWGRCSCWCLSCRRAVLVVLGGSGEGVEQVAEFGEVEGLGEVGERAAGEQAADDTWGGLGGQDHDRDGGGGWFGSEFLEDVLAVDVAQVQVEQDEAGNVAGGAFEAGLAGFGGLQPDAWPAPQEP